MAGAAPTVRLSGPPDRLSALVAVESTRSRVFPVRLRLNKDASIARLRLRPVAPGMSEARLRLPADTAPGHYSGEGEVQQEHWSIELDVEAREHLSVHPRRTHVRGAPGERVEFRLTIINDGNVPQTLPEAAAFDLDDAEGQDRALGRTLRAELSEGEKRVDRLFEELRATHGGEARITVKGGGPLQPGESGEIECLLDLPTGVREGHTYLGGWRLGAAHPLVVVDVTPASGPRRRG
ncbi:MAG: hypothetical protein R3E10_10085 [Gemmatimonadota bacterium]